MPAIAKGSLKPVGPGKFRARWRDAEGEPQSKTLAMSKTDAQKWLDAKVDEVEAIRRGDVISKPKVDAPTFDDLCREFLSNHTASESTITTLMERLRRPRQKWGSTRVDRFSVSELRSWAKTLPPAYAPMIVRAMRAALSYAQECGYVSDNAAKSIKIAAPKRTEKTIFGSSDDARKLGKNLPIAFRAVPLLGVATGLRPEELFALQREDIDRAAGVIRIRRVLVDGELKNVMKTDGSMRDVPLSTLALEALAMILPRVDTPLLFATKSGKAVSLNNFRGRDWRPAIAEAGLDPALTPYSMRHTALSWWISNGLDLKTVATIGGTSIRMLDAHYSHVVPGYLDRAREIMDAAAAR